ncbi:hypothetical protein LTR47_002888 [Exophiala xenobiotica]|nr:hypothetical protein LTR41_004632 [Exophiala xenobiotica]KAK5225874.1 hypothetical protein LTR72_003777 [Exophiala xenobiotica]KAK5236162.1 hypothetical protein LTR47_002888 [Exophiala xenobiotica]KAK5255156.1 hypothetical protein LTS06_000569 [Exophiala xenobiotica]KAK5298694.1 hypothetical protein LTR14_002545 [Exophiala xenobiotica]
MRDLENKVVIVTGAASGIALATSEVLLSYGANVLGCDIGAMPPSVPAANEANFSFLQCDLTQEDSAQAVVQRCQQQFGGRIDALCNIAGIMDNNSSVDTYEDEIWERNIAINMTAPARLMREVVPVMLAQGGGGSIVNTASFAALSGAAAGICYTACKHAMVSFVVVVAVVAVVIILVVDEEEEDLLYLSQYQSFAVANLPACLT